MKKSLVVASCTAAFSVAMAGLTGCGGSSSAAAVVPVAAISSFTAASATITDGTSTTITGVFTGGAGVITPGNIAATSGTAVTVSPTATTTYTLTVTPAGGAAVTKTVTITVTAAASSTVTVDLTSSGPKVTDQLLGMNMAAWFDDASSTNEPMIQSAFQEAGIKAIRWPGGSWSDAYNWETNTECGSTANSNDDFTDFVNNLIIPAGLDLALTADYGTGENCTGPGDPAEAASWAAKAVTLGVPASHMTVGNEEYGSWETDNHTLKNDATTYAAAVTGASGYYALIKAASPGTLVGVDVNPGNSPAWDPIVLSGAPYDFVEFHYYPEAPGSEDDTFIVQQAAQQLTTNINTIKSELATAGVPNTPIYVGEMGSVSSNPGKQSMSITQALFAGQVLGEMMNDGVSRATWWIGFGNCNGAAGNDSSSLYGWQSYGAYNVFSDGPSEDPTCPDSGPIGTLDPTALAFQLFSNVAVNGENALTAAVAGETTDVVAYAATHSGGTALVVFNRNETTPEPVTISLSGTNSSNGVTVITYSKAIYDQSQNNVWAPPTTTPMGAQSLPLTLTLAPWSMNVVLLQ